jgi:hypothetical protein
VKISNSTLRLLALLLIGLAAGPEIGLAMEMTTLLEILGAALFFTSFSVGARMLVMDLVTALRSFVYPVFIVGQTPSVILAHAGSRVLWAVGMALVIGNFLREFANGTLV